MKNISTKQKKVLNTLLKSDIDVDFQCDEVKGVLSSIKGKLSDPNSMTILENAKEYEGTHHIFNNIVFLTKKNQN